MRARGHWIDGRDRSLIAQRFYITDIVASDTRNMPAISTWLYPTRFN